MTTITLDDRDKSIVYSTGWRTGGSSTEHNGTTMYTNTSGATATLTFDGVGISVYGTVSGTTRLTQTPPQSSYKLDENEAVLFQPIGIAPQQDYLFYQSSQRLSNKQHTLVVTNMINGSTILVLDYMKITMASPSSGNQHIPVIAGTISGVVGCMLLILGVFYFRRRRKRQVEDNHNSDLVPDIWVHPSHRSTTPLPPSKSMPTNSLPSTPSNNHAPLTNESDQPAPPAYTTVVCMVTTGTAPSMSNYDNSSVTQTTSR